MNARSQTCLSLEYFSRVINSQEPIESLILTEIRLTITDVLFVYLFFSRRRALPLASLFLTSIKWGFFPRNNLTKIRKSIHLKQALEIIYSSIPKVVSFPRHHPNEYCNFAIN